MPELRLIESHELILSPLNPRTVPPSEAEVAALAGSIDELGLLQNLIGLDRGERLEIVGGGLRLRALLTLPSQEVEVLVYDDADAAVAAALAENEVRQAMGPVDRFRAFLGLREAGRSEARIARAYATDTAEVARILALKACAPEVLEALAGGRIDLDQARAFTVTRDLGRQVEFLSRVSGTRWHPDSLRRELRAREDEADVLRAIKFVGLEAYEAAGGAVIRDLFGGRNYIEDHALLFRLRDERLAAAAALETARGWSWAIVGGEPAGARRISPGESGDPLSEDEDARLQDLEEAEGLAELDLEDRGELEALRARAELEQSGVWSADQMAVGGLALSLGYGGELVRVEGLVRPEDEARAVELGVLRPRAAPAAAAGEAEAEEPAGLPASLVADLHGLRAIAVSNVLSRSVEMALWVLAWHLVTGSSGLIAGGLRPGATADGAGLGLERDAPDPIREVGGFADFVSRGKKVRNAVLAAEVARAFGMGWSNQACAETAAIAAAMGVDLRTVWTPGEAFFRRLKSAQLSVIHGCLTGVFLPAGAKKAEAVAALAGLFAEPRLALAALREELGEDAILPDAEARIAAWLPEPLRPPVEAEADQDSTTTEEAA